ncbi:hypothetical protein [Rhodopirellula sp. MGV]|uniref:hypothetical protein n=1 Tax=Rhodopirellula sp. MGV TaxID=2023130 RepID=UPI001179F3CA|nr:hypothetical protein [Rhodopirellula sp. MGV]
MPGAQNLIQVDVTDIFCIGYEQAPEVRWYLEFLYPLMRVSEYDWDRSTDAFDDLASSRSLSELNSATRIAVAERIPELIQLAKAGEKALARKAQNAADAIEQAFAQLDEDDQ